MFHLHQSLNYYLYPFPVDMRKSFYTLSGIVTGSMGKDVQNGDVFIFVNRKQSIMKILHMEYAGLVIYHKKLESGRFQLPSFNENTHSIIYQWSDLILLVQNVKTKPKRLKRKEKY